MAEIHGYVFTIDYSKNLSEQNLLHETKVLLSLIYRDYICTPEKKQELLRKDDEELKRAEEILREKYNPDNLFKKKTTKVEPEEEKQEQMVVYKENIFAKIFSKIKNFWKRLRKH